MTINISENVRCPNLSVHAYTYTCFSCEWLISCRNRETVLIILSLRRKFARRHREIWKGGWKVRWSWARSRISRDDGTQTCPWRVSSRYRGAKEESNTCCIRQWFLFRHENFEYWRTPRYLAKLFFSLLEETPAAGRFILLSKISELHVAILNLESHKLF